MRHKEEGQDGIRVSSDADLRRWLDAENACRNASEIAKALSHGQISRRDLVKWGLLTSAGIMVPAGGLIGCGGTAATPNATTPNQSLSESPSPWTISIENAKPGTHKWQITHPARNHEIQGFASLTSVNRGEGVAIFVDTPEPTYTVEVFRMGWYGGKGGRLMMPAVVRTGTQQPMPLPDPETHLLECQWDDPYVLRIPKSSDPTDWASGIYVVKLTAGASGRESYVIFAVRDDERPSNLLFQSSVTTFAAYNDWAGWSLYTNPRAYMVSFNRPYRQGSGAGDFFNWEYAMVRFLEREGYDVTYSTNVDTHVRGHLLLSHKALLSVGHDEYWSWQMRDNLEAAREAGVSLGFFGANAGFWQIRFQPDSGSGEVPDRTFVCYKQAHLDPAGNKKYPLHMRRLTTTEFRLPPVDRPEDSLIGVMYRSILDHRADIVIEDASSWVFENTGLSNGDRLLGLLGYEADQVFGNAPPGTQRIAHSPYQDSHGESLYSDMVFYTWRSGATVVATGSMQWNWGLDEFNPVEHSKRTTAAVQQATRNILNRFIATAK